MRDLMRMSLARLGCTAFVLAGIGCEHSDTASQSAAEVAAPATKYLVKLDGSLPIDADNAKGSLTSPIQNGLMPILANCTTGPCAYLVDVTTAKMSDESAL